MKCIFGLASVPVRAGLLGFGSGALSCGLSQSFIIVREQRTLDHIVWPGLVFALVVLFPVSRWAGDGWLRTVASLIASSAAYPIAWRIAVSGIGHPGPLMIAAFALAGFLGSAVLAGVFLFGRPRWVRAAGATVVLGAVIGGLMGAHLLATVTGVASPLSAGDGLGVFLVVWQTAVGVSLGRGVLHNPTRRWRQQERPATPGMPNLKPL